jgi:glycyl-tRNA synthetase beta chain
MKKPLLIEIGVEELPAIPFLKELPNITTKWLSILEKNGLKSDFDFFYTPRRLVFWHREFPLKQEDSFVEFFGAPIDIAYKDSKPTPAALGFAKKCGVTLEELSSTKKGSKEVLYYKKEQKGLDSKSLLSNMILELLQTLNFGKSMRWGNYDYTFIRPIRWLGCMLDNQIVPMNVYGVDSSNISYGHRTISYEPFEYSSSGDYFCKLDKAGVILYPHERKSHILKQFKEIETINFLTIDLDEELLAEVVAITEYPNALLGSFDEKFLKLPQEVIIASMKEHQRYFPVFKDGVLVNKFIVVSNAKSDNFEKIIAGNEKVLKARLSDGLFFYENDLKNGLNNEGLKNVTFIHDGGSIYDKVVREASIGEYLHQKYQASHDVKDSSLLEKTIMMSKSDLLSDMVYEFTELQGIMGYYYATAAKEDESLALALKEQYLPSGEDSELPSNDFSAIVSMSSKIDSILMLFSLGKIPTGTKDPFALRRAVISIIKIVLDRGFSFDIERDLKKLSASYKDFDFLILENFFIERFVQYFNVNPSVIHSVLKSGERDIVEISKKIEALNIIVSREDFREVSSTFKRVANIVKDVKGKLTIDPTLFSADAEKALFEAFMEVDKKSFDSYLEKLESLFALKPSIDRFFDEVMVNVEDISVKNNRKNLIATIYNAFREIAEIKEVTV